MNAMSLRRAGLLLAVLLCMGGCGSPQSQKSGEAERGKRVIGVSVLTMANPFFKTVADAMADEAAKHGYEVSVVSGDLDAAKQQAQVRDFLVQKVSAMVLMPCDSKAIGAVIQEANQAGIPVFTADIACLAPEAKVVAHIATDNHSGGRLAAETLVEAIGGKGKVAVLGHPTVESAIMRSKGFQERLAELNSAGKANVQLVAELPGLGERDQGFKCTQDLLQSHADIAGIFAVNDPSALGAIAALKNAGKLGKVKVVGFDGQPEAKESIRDGQLDATLIQFPEQIGREAVRAIALYFDGGKPSAEKLIDTQVYRRADARKDPALQ